MSNFEKSSAALASLDPPQILKFEREDWSLFRTVEGLQQRAGVRKELLRRLVLKEITDNGLDCGGRVSVGEEAGVYYVEDDGPGIPPADVARLFSIARPMESTKLLRLPSRGALGNGLRVVAGAVLASGGELTVITRNKRIELRPERDGSTTVVSVVDADQPIGTRVEVKFGAALPEDDEPKVWALRAIDLNRGETYRGKTSPWWYDPATFHEVLYASGKAPVRELVASLDGCSGGKAGEIVAAAGLSRETCVNVTRDKSDRLLDLAKCNAKAVKPARLGYVGPNAYLGTAYGVYRGNIGGIPYVVEAWAHSVDITYLRANVNRTPITAELHVQRVKRDINFFGCGLRHTIATAPKDENFFITLNILTPYMPITSDGKAPNLLPFYVGIAAAVAVAVRKARNPSAVGRSQKSIVLDNLNDAIANVSDNGRYRFNQRQLLYVLRPIVREELDKELTVENFTTIITNYENESGEIPGMYREPRGSIYHPHRDETITLGTLMVEEYDRPAWTFNKLLYIEKEGFSEALKDIAWPERHECAVMSSKGFSTRAARDLIDKLAEHDEPVTVFCVHDADAWGTMIYQTLCEETKARGARKVNIINLGLEPDEAMEMGLEVEPVEEKERRKPVAEYALEWEDWFQTKRVELNAMTTPQFIEWLNGKFAEYDKLIPPPDALIDEYVRRLEGVMRADIAARILREASFEDQVSAALASAEIPEGGEIEAGIRHTFEENPESDWRDYIEERVARGG